MKIRDILFYTLFLTWKHFILTTLILCFDLGGLAALQHVYVGVWYGMVYFIILSSKSMCMVMYGCIWRFIIMFYYLKKQVYCGVWWCMVAFGHVLSLKSMYMRCMVNQFKAKASMYLVVYDTVWLYGGLKSRSSTNQHVYVGVW